jgi:hypothetical protein
MSEWKSIEVMNGRWEGLEVVGVTVGTEEC